MFRDSNWLLEPPFLTVKLLRKLTGILDVPGILGTCVKMRGLDGGSVVSNVSGWTKKWDARCTRQGLGRGFVTWKLPVSQTGVSFQDSSLLRGRIRAPDTTLTELWGLAARRGRLNSFRLWSLDVTLRRWRKKSYASAILHGILQPCLRVSGRAYIRMSIRCLASITTSNSASRL